MGLAISMRDERAHSRVGTLQYMAPEVIQMKVRQAAANATAHALAATTTAGDASADAGGRSLPPSDYVPTYDHTVDIW